MIKYMKIKKSDIEGGPAVKLDGYKYTEIIEDECFFSPGFMEQVITLKSWVWNWKFPFLHHKVESYTIAEWQQKLTDTLDWQISQQLK